MNDNKIKLVRYSLLVSFVLLIIKFTAYIITCSNAILTDALESIVNVAASSFALFSIWFASLPQDRNHPYGHGKIEYFSSGFEGGLILIAGVAIIINASIAFFEPPKVRELGAGIILTSFAGLINYVVGVLLKRSGRKNDSLLMIASGQHLVTDTLTSIGLVAGLAVVYFTQLLWLDNVIAIIFGTIILATGFRLVKKSIGGLLDETDMQKVDLIIDQLDKNRRPKWIDIHNFRIQKFGSKLHVDCHVTLPWYATLDESHNEINELEKTIQQSSGREIEFFIHTDPCVMPDSCRICQISDCKERKSDFIKKIDWNARNLMPNEKHHI